MIKWARENPLWIARGLGVISAAGAIQIIDYIDSREAQAVGRTLPPYTCPHVAYIPPSSLRPQGGFTVQYRQIQRDSISGLYSAICDKPPKGL